MKRETVTELFCHLSQVAWPHLNWLLPSRRLKRSRFMRTSAPISRIRRSHCCNSSTGFIAAPVARANCWDNFCRCQFASPEQEYFADGMVEGSFQRMLPVLRSMGMTVEVGR